MATTTSVAGMFHLRPKGNSDSLHISLMTVLLFIAVGRPEMKDLCISKIIKELSAACEMNRNIWRHLGYLLSLSESDISIIQVDNETSVERRCSAMFELWLMKESDASWWILREALLHLGLRHLADIVNNWFLSEEMSSGCASVDANTGTLNFNLVCCIFIVCTCMHVCVCVGGNSGNYTRVETRS